MLLTHIHASPDDGHECLKNPMWCNTKSAIFFRIEVWICNTLFALFSKISLGCNTFSAYFFKKSEWTPCKRKSRIGRGKDVSESHTASSSHQKSLPPERAKPYIPLCGGAKPVYTQQASSCPVLQLYRAFHTAVLIRKIA